MTCYQSYRNRYQWYHKAVCYQWYQMCYHSELLIVCASSTATAPPASLEKSGRWS